MVTDQTYDYLYNSLKETSMDLKLVACGEFQFVGEFVDVILNVFCSVSGLGINVDKTKVLITLNGHHLL